MKFIYITDEHYNRITINYSIADSIYHSRNTQKYSFTRLTIDQIPGSAFSNAVCLYKSITQF